MESNKGSMNSGPAPAPSRSVKLNVGGPQEINVEVPQSLDHGATVGELVIHDAPSRINQEPRTYSSPPPENPEQAVADATEETRVGELTQALGKQREEFEREKEAMRLEFEGQMAAFSSQQRTGGLSQEAQAAIPPGLDLEGNVTIGQMLTIMDNMMPHVREQIVRQNWDVTPQEEQTILQANPHFNQIADAGKRVELIQRTAKLMRARSDSANSPKSAKTPPAQASSGNIRPAQRTVPHVEANTSPSAPDLTPTNPSMDYAQKYEEAKKIQNPKEREAQMKHWFKKAQEAAGISDEQMANSMFRQTV